MSADETIYALVLNRRTGDTTRIRLVLWPGQVVATAGALALAERLGLDLRALVLRHLAGDWGDLDAHDRAANDHALRTGARLLSAYDVGQGARLWVITEGEGGDGQRASTCLLLPEEY